MASGNVGDVKKCLSKFKDRSETTECLKLTNFIKCLESCDCKQYKTTVEASIWAIFQDKAKKVAIDKIATDLINEVAADVIAKKRKQTKGRAPVDDPEVQTLANEIRAKIAAKAGDEQKAIKVDATTARLTDASGYTGSHKERFTADGKGKGKEGRADVAENTGYVGNYKGAGTFDKKH
ncbi:tubulin polymerization-promoting protein family member 2-like [Physella acuta]|uniref:tubulin polymerization-promoting protein family member 2-like n=1 Tax=Physella acuta TaxID=109671 RepID=UPI0027DE7D69|nr:tubulin polymerization-promoting protein family member 2-like [Physella acuta]